MVVTWCNDKHLWGELCRISQSDNVLANLLSENRIAVVREDKLPGDIRDPETDDFLNPKYEGVELYLEPDIPRDSLHQIKQPDPEKAIPDHVSGPIFLPDEQAIIEDLSMFNKDDVSIFPESTRKEPVEWSGSGQNTRSDRAKKRSNAYNTGDRSGKDNGLLSGKK